MCGLGSQNGPAAGRIFVRSTALHLTIWWAHGCSCATAGAGPQKVGDIVLGRPHARASAPMGPAAPAKAKRPPCIAHSVGPKGAAQGQRVHGCSNLLLNKGGKEVAITSGTCSHRYVDRRLVTTPVQYALELQCCMLHSACSATTTAQRRRGPADLPPAAFGPPSPAVWPCNVSLPLALACIKCKRNSGQQQSEGGSRASPSTPSAWHGQL